MINKKSFIILVGIVLNVSISFSQQLSDATHSYIYNNVYKNIAAYNMKYNPYAINGVRDKYLVSNTYFFQAFLPDEDYKLKLRIEPMNLEYPVKAFKVFSIYMDGFRFINDKTDKEQFKMGVSEQILANSKYLIAVSNEATSIKFLSGQFFLTPISKDFDFSPDEPSSYVDYLKIKLFNFAIENIRFFRRKRDKLYYHAYSKELHKEIEIRISLNDIENPTIIR